MDETLELLAARVDPRLSDVSRAQVSLLVRWLGYFGSNTHLGTGPDGESLALYPGERLTSIKVKSAMNNGPYACPRARSEDVGLAVRGVRANWINWISAPEFLKVFPDL